MSGPPGGGGVPDGGRRTVGQDHDVPPAAAHDPRDPFRVGGALVRQVADQAQPAGGELATEGVGERLVGRPPAAADVHLFRLALAHLPALEGVNAAQKFGRRNQSQSRPVRRPEVVPFQLPNRLPLARDVAVVEP